MRAYRRWTEPEIADLRADWAAGVTLVQMAARFGRSVSSVHSKVKDLQLPMRTGTIELTGGAWRYDPIRGIQVWAPDA